MALWMMPPEYKSRADEKAEKLQAAKAQEQAVYAAVDTRDGMICRACGCRLVKSLALHPKRREHHHIVPRSQGGVTETWNIANVCMADHELITRHRMVVSGNADQVLTFGLEGQPSWTSPAPHGVSVERGR